MDSIDRRHKKVPCPYAITLVVGGHCCSHGVPHQSLLLPNGLYLAGAIRGSLLLLLVVRYPILLIGVFVIYFVRGPRPLQPTLIGRATTLATSAVLLVIAANSFLIISWPTPLWIEWCVRLLYILIGANILYLINRAVTWASRRENPGSSSG